MRVNAESRLCLSSKEENVDSAQSMKRMDKRGVSKRMCFCSGQECVACGQRRKIEPSREEIRCLYIAFFFFFFFFQRYSEGWDRQMAKCNGGY